MDGVAPQGRAERGGLAGGPAGVFAGVVLVAVQGLEYDHRVGSAGQGREQVRRLDLLLVVAVVDAAGALGEQHRADPAGGRLGQLLAPLACLAPQLRGDPASTVGVGLDRRPEPGHRFVVGQPQPGGQHRVDVRGGEDEGAHEFVGSHSHTGTVTVYSTRLPGPGPWLFQRQTVRVVVSSVGRSSFSAIAVVYTPVLETRSGRCGSSWPRNVRWLNTMTHTPSAGVWPATPCSTPISPALRFPARHGAARRTASPPCGRLPSLSGMVGCPFGWVCGWCRLGLPSLALHLQIYRSRLSAST